MQVGLKERLIGAAVLVIVAAIVIPWVLKGNSTPGGATVNKPLALPAATSSGPVQTYRLPLNSSAATAPGASALPAAGTTQPAAPVPQANNPALAPQAQPAAPAVQSARPALQPSVQPAAPVPAGHAPPPARLQSSGSAPAGKWVVQAGSYDSERAALAVERKLVAHGYRAYVSRFHSKERTYYRVRVGPYTSREEAARSVAGVSRAAGAKAAVMSNS